VRHYLTSLNGWLVLLSVGTVVPVLVFAGFTLWSVLTAHDRQQHATVLDRVRPLAFALDAELRAAKATATTLATSQALEQGRLAEFYQEARRVGERQGAWVAMLDGQDPPQQLFNTLQPYGTRLPRGSRSALAVFRDKAPLVLDPFVGSVTQRPMIVVSVPVFREGEVIYCLNLDFSPDRFSWLLAQQKFGPAVAVISDRKQRMVARSADADQWFPQRAPDWLPPAAGSETSGIVENVSLDGRPVHVAFQRLTEVPWMVHLIVPDAGQSRPLLAFIGIALLLGAAAAGIAVVVARQIGRPIVQIALRAAALVQGEPTDLRLTTPIREVRRLHAALLAAGEKSRAYQRELEARVTERTAGLHDALLAKEAALANNVTLLREVHHRVKNNLQMLCDMLYLQMEALGGTEQTRALSDSYTRIYAIARLHEQLYQSLESGHVRLDEYLKKLLGGFEALYPHITPHFTATGDSIHVDVDRAIHIGLIVNELVTNAAKYAFPEGQQGEVRVRLRALGDDLELEVRDAGRGLPANLDLAQAKTLGLRIVHILATRLKATVGIENVTGAAFTIRFPITEEKAPSSGKE
jgi:two-component sensor histidine kinase